MKMRYGGSKDAKVIKISVIIFLIGVLLGAIGANIFKDSYFNGIEVFGETYFDKLNVLDIDRGKLLGYIIWSNFKKYLLFWVFAVTILGIPYMLLKVGYSGICTGFILSVALLKYGFKGVILYLIYLFPQYIIYFPIAIITLVLGFNLCISLYYRTPLNKKSKMKMILEKVPMILLLFLMILIGSLSEAYINSFILQKIVKFF